MGEIAVGIATGILASLIASSLFLLTLVRLRPVLQISPVIAEEEDEDGRFYAFKVVNRCRFPIINIKAELTILKPARVPGGHEIKWSSGVDLNRDTVFQLPAYSKGGDTGYAYRFCTDSNLHDIWRSNRDTLRLRVVATHSVSGFSRTFEQVYGPKWEAIVPGSHEGGASLNVVRRPPPQTPPDLSSPNGPPTDQSN